MSPYPGEKILSPVARDHWGLPPTTFLHPGASLVISGPRQIGNYPSARARSPRLRLIDFFRGANARHFRRDRDRENRDGPIERLRDEEASRWKAGSKRLLALRHTERRDVYHTRVDGRDNHDKMVDEMAVENRGQRKWRKGGQLAGDVLLVIAASPKLDPCPLVLSPLVYVVHGCRPVKDAREIVFNRVRVIKRSFKRRATGRRGLVSTFATSWNLSSSFPFLLFRGGGFPWWATRRKRRDDLVEFRWEICVRVGLDPVPRGWLVYGTVSGKLVSVYVVCYYNSYKSLWKGIGSQRIFLFEF